MRISLLSVVSVITISLCLFSCSGTEELPLRMVEDFPFDPAKKHDGDFIPSAGWSQLSDNLYRFEDCCNVYAVTSGTKALLIDFGSGAILNRLKKAGITTIDHVLVTHHHRDQVQGLCELENRTFRVTVPAAEKQFFDDVEKFWQEVKLYINYNCRSHWNTVRRSIQPDDYVSDGDNFTWNGIEFTVIGTPGHTDGSVSYSAEIDGHRVIFTGDLIAGAGKVVNWFDLHWNYYGFTQGIDASDTSFAKIRDENPGLLLPSHGKPVENPSEAMAENSSIYKTLRARLVPNEMHRPSQVMRQILPHLIYLGSTGYAIISDSGKAFIYDFGYVNRERVSEFKKKYNISAIDAVSFSHYHDDHCIRTYELTRRESVKIWIYENMLDVFENPVRYKLPCLLPFPIYADRVLHDGDKIQWEEFTLEFMYLPGQTEFHQGLYTVIDGKKILFTGDNTWKKIHPHASRNGPVVPHNEYFLDGGFITCAQKMLSFMPDIVCPAHTEEYSPSRQDLEEFLEWAYRLRDIMTGLIDQPDPNFGMDYRWCRFYPYRTIVKDDTQFTVELLIRNHLFKPAQVDVTLKCGGTISCPEPERSVTIAPKKQAVIPFTISGCPGEKNKREIITADIKINGKYLGEYAEAMIDIGR